MTKSLNFRKNDMKYKTVPTSMRLSKRRIEHVCRVPKPPVELSAVELDAVTKFMKEHGL